ncbi:VCBS repeat-containing protein [Streptomyces sp. NPDC089919]|uniref:FG-GAP repeat domain-containing protein n=1 Tax=Streptomyces sp. NPDC089919 TaxID=3155188 RepID=UPI0034199D8E
MRLLRTSKPDFVYPPNRTPADGPAYGDPLGDLTGDGYADMLATTSGGTLRLYPGRGDGRFGTSRTVGRSGWKGALIAHGGDFGPGFGSADGYEDFLVRFAGGKKLFLIPNDGTGGPLQWGRQELVRRDAHGRPLQDWSRVRQLLTPGDLDLDKALGRRNGNDLLVRECTDASCSARAGGRG